MTCTLIRQPPFHINHCFKSVSEVALLHKFHFFYHHKKHFSIFFLFNTDICLLLILCHFSFSSLFLSPFFLSVGDNTELPIRVDLSLNKKSNKQTIKIFHLDSEYSFYSVIWETFPSITTFYSIQCFCQQTIKTDQTENVLIQATDNLLYTDTRYNNKTRYNDNFTVTKPSIKR